MWLPFISLATEQQQWNIAELSIKTNDQGVLLEADSVGFDEYSIDGVAYQCHETLTVYPVHQCQGAKLNFNYNGKSYETLFDSLMDFHSSSWNLALTTVDQKLTFALSSADPSGHIKFSNLNVTDILKLIDFGNADYSLPAMLLTGELVVDLEKLTVSNTEPIEFHALNYEYSDDIVVADLAGSIMLTYDFKQQKFSYSLSLDAGEMLFDQLYVDFLKYPISLSGLVSQQASDWYAASVKIENRQSLNMSAAVEFKDFDHWRNPNFTATVTDSHHFNQQILGSILGIYGFGKSGMSGEFIVTAESKQTEFDQWNIQFNDYYFLNEGRKIAAEALNGTINWYKNQSSPDSNLNWDNLLLAGLPINSAASAFNFSKDQFELIGSHEFPIFDGSIQLKELRVESLFSEFVDMNLNASLVPISLKLITEKMGWPILSGTISGDIPGMVKKGSVIKFMGALNLSVFNGHMQVENLSMERLFGVAPVIAANVKFNEFDLSLLTETFGFGLITGNLSGRVNDLRITNWKTDRLDAEVYTVKTKGVKQIISQRAIENISSLGGIKGAISKTFLRFFDDFKYKQIKLSCKLHNSVCLIGGIKNKNNQFVMVEGGGIPKINIVGFVRAINWQEFIDRLLNANYDN